MTDIAHLHKTLVQELNIGSLPQDQQDAILAELSENIMKRLALDVLQELPQEARAEFDTISESQDQQKLESFLREKIPNMDAISQQSIRKTIDEFKELAPIK